MQPVAQVWIVFMFVMCLDSVYVCIYGLCCLVGAVQVVLLIKGLDNRIGNCVCDREPSCCGQGKHWNETCVALVNTFQCGSCA